MTKLLWLDLETTGLDTQKGSILEVALMTADMADPFEASPAFHSVVFFPERRWGELGPGVLEMHTKNGLLQECARTEAPDYKQVEQMLLQHVPDEKERDDRPVLAGSSVYFDYLFIQANMPQVFRRLQYRLYDVSALKLYCQSMGMPKFRKAEAYRAAADIAESIMHAKECTTWLQVNLRSKQP